MANNNLGLSDDEYNQLSFYASLSGMSVEEYAKYMAQNQADQQIQAPQRQYEAQSQTPDQRTQTNQNSAIQNAVNATNVQNQSLAAQNRQNQETYWNNNVTPAFNTNTQAFGDLQSANRQGEGEIQAGGQALNNALGQTQAQRVGAINSTNAAQTQALGQLTGSLNGINANQTGLFNNLSGQAGAINSNQTGLYNNLNNQLGDYTSAQNAANNQLSGDMAQQTLQGNEYTAQFGNSLDALNIKDDATLQRYLGATDPMLATMKAQSSDPRYVQQMQDSYDQYKKLSNPEVTAQERFLAEQLRQKTENQDKSSRDAAYLALQQRGLNSGGQQIAAQLANRQATSQDRVLGNLGVLASAQQRAQVNMAGAAGVAQQLRGADDAMKQFQDQFAQNDAVRRYGVAQGQANTGLAVSTAQGNRDTAKFQGQQQNLQGATNRSGMTFNAATATNNANTQRAGMSFEAGTATNNANFGRNQSVANFGLAGNQLASQNAGLAFNGASSTNDANFNRSNIGFQTADQNALTGYGTAKDLANTRSQNRSSEAGLAQGSAGLALSGAGQYGNIQNSVTRAQQDALTAALGHTIVANTSPPKTGDSYNGGNANYAANGYGTPIGPADTFANYNSQTDEEYKRGGTPP